MDFSVGSEGGPVIALPVRRRLGGTGTPVAGTRLLSDVFDVLPVGVLVVSASGEAITWNPALEELLGGALERGRTTCCELFGCRTPGTALEGICLAQAATRDPLPGDVTVEPRAAPGSPVTITTRRMRGGRARPVLLQVRAATHGIARVPPRPAAGVIRIRTLGETVVETHDAEMRGGWLDQRAGTLLKYLVARRDAVVHADAIAEALWPRARADTTNTVRHFVHALRERLEPNRSRYQRSEFVIARRGGYQLNGERVQIDADEFEREAAAGLEAMVAGDRPRAVERLSAAMTIYKGDFLPDEPYEDWAIPERERLRVLAAKPLHALAALTDDPDDASVYLERLVEMEPLDVDVHRQLLGLWVSQGRRSRAVRHYRALQLRLMREFGERITFDLPGLGSEWRHSSEERRA